MNSFNLRGHNQNSKLLANKGVWRILVDFTDKIVRPKWNPKQSVSIFYF